MKRVKVFFIIVVATVGAFIGWYYFASAVNSHVDKAASTIIEDVATGNIIHALQQIDLVQASLKSGEINKATEQLQSMSENYLFMLSQCELQKCKDAINKLGQ